MKNQDKELIHNIKSNLINSLNLPGNKISEFLLCSLIKRKIMIKLIKTIEAKSANAMKVIFRLKKI